MGGSVAERDTARDVCEYVDRDGDGDSERDTL